MMEEVQFMRRITIKRLIVVNLFAWFSLFANANMQVFTCEPEWQSLVLALGGDKVTVFSATTGLQDPHQVQARPSLIVQMRNSDLLVCSGAELEIGWLPLLLRRSSNQGLKEGKPGYFMASEHVRLLGVPKTIDRSLGDVHVSGNPHVHTNPKNIGLVAKALVKRMKIIDPQQASYYQERADDFLLRWNKALKRWKQQTRQLKNVKVVVQHASWAYLNDFVKLEQVATIEEKPGIPVTSGHLQLLSTLLKQQPAQMIMRAAYQSGKASEWLSKKTGIATVNLPFTVGGSEKAVDLFSLFDETFALLTEQVKNNKFVEEKIK